MDETIYNKEFHAGRRQMTLYSAKKVLGYLKTFYDYKSVCDFGCGTGTWLSVVNDMLSVDNEQVEIYGVDGDYVTDDMLEISKEYFHPADLNQSIYLEKHFDLAISLEVAEHLLPERADSFVEDLSKASDVVLFSAAIPMQGGEGHINEQFLSYWTEKFKMRGYMLIDCIRPFICDDEQIPWWYRQNMVVFIKNNKKLYDTFNKIKSTPYVDIIDKNSYISNLSRWQRASQNTAGCRVSRKQDFIAYNNEQAYAVDDYVISIRKDIDVKVINDMIETLKKISIKV